MSKCIQILPLIAVNFFLLTTASRANPCAKLPLQIEVITKKAQNGDAYCKAILALEYYRGSTGVEDEVRGDELSAEVVDSQDPLAMYVAATLFRTGSPSQRIAKDEGRSKQLNLAFVGKIDPATTTDANHLIALGFVRNYGRDGLESDPSLACTYMRRAADLGHPHGMVRLAKCIAEGHLEEKAGESEYSWLVTAAELGHPQAAWDAGKIDHRANQLGDALKKYQLAVKNGDAKFALWLGKLHEAGLIGAPNWHKAKANYASASERGNSNASYRMGWVYLTGFGDFEKDFSAAKAAFETARNQGDPRAETVLSIIAD